ncbi:recombinase family protein [Anaerotignum sp.]|uniref:recombinase family protein n=1 Tax=Anaerotignum sp. TaxID=2039241 RepID=UPI0028975451|nr:recombinase family protein [Anaerotignum sp.]
MVIGYARVSTDKQELLRQEDALKKYGVDELYTEKMTGTKSDRPELNKVKLRAREGDSVVVESLSRLGRSSKDLLILVDEWEKQGITLVSLKESIDTKTPTGKLLITVLSAICQFERDITVQRTKEGLASARARGRKGGRPKADSKVVEKAIKLYHAQTHSIKEIVDITGISQATLYRELKRNENK